MNPNEFTLFDAGLFIGGLFSEDKRYGEARPLIEGARQGAIRVCTTTGILSEVYAALTWIGTQPPLDPGQAAKLVRLLIEPPSKINVLSAGLEASRLMLELAEKYTLTARRIHDARHAAIALVSGVSHVYTYDLDDWKLFKADGLEISGPPSVLGRKKA